MIERKRNAGRPKVHKIVRDHGVKIVTSRLPRRLHRGARRKRFVPRTPKIRVPGDEAMRAIIGARSYTDLARGMGADKGEVSKFCRGRSNPHVEWVRRFAQVAGVGVAEVIAALDGIAAGRSETPLTSKPTAPRAVPTGLPDPSPVPRPPKVRPAFERLVAPPAPFYRERQGEAPLTIGYAPRFEDEGGFVWED